MYNLIIVVAKLGSDCRGPSNLKACANLLLATCHEGKCSCSGGSMEDDQKCVCGTAKTLNPAKNACVTGR